MVPLGYQKDKVLEETRKAFENMLRYYGVMDWPGVEFALEASWIWIDQVTSEISDLSLGTAMSVAVYRILYKLSLMAVPQADKWSLGDMLASSAVEFVDEGGTPEDLKKLTSLSEDITTKITGMR